MPVPCSAPTAELDSSVTRSVSDVEEAVLGHGDTDGPFIERVYEEADYVGSLVVPDGEQVRPTDWIRTNPGGDIWTAPGSWGWWRRDG
jgi:hypothetical protein